MNLIHLLFNQQLHLIEIEIQHFNAKVCIANPLISNLYVNILKLSAYKWYSLYYFLISLSQILILFENFHKLPTCTGIRLMQVSLYCVWFF